jgi:hypothetical protein
LDTLAQSVLNNSPHGSPSRTGGFESGVDGWVACATHITCIRDTNHVRYGKYCLKIAGFAGNQNVCAARALLSCPCALDSVDRLLAVALWGQGTFSLRARVPKNKKWVYFNGVRFNAAKAAKYTDYTFKQWTTVQLALTGQLAQAREIEVEIRVKKQTAIDLHIDNVSIKNRPDPDVD